MFKLFESSDGKEVLVRTINQWLEDNPDIFVQSFDYHTYHKSCFAYDAEIIHCLMINYNISK